MTIEEGIRQSREAAGRLVVVTVTDVARAIGEIQLHYREGKVDVLQDQVHDGHPGLLVVGERGEELTGQTPEFRLFLVAHREDAGRERSDALV